MADEEEVPTEIEIEVSNKSLQYFLIVFVLGTLLSNLPPQYALFEKITYSFVLTALMLLGTASLAMSKRVRFFSGVFGILAIVSHWIQYYEHGNLFEIAETINVVVFFAILLAALLARVFDRNEVDIYKLEGAVVAFLLIAVAFGNLYTVIELLSSGSFLMNGSAVPNEYFLERKNLIYFSMTTITTLGLGDIVPINPIARSLVIFEAGIGVLFPNILIARLVSLEIIHSQSKPKKKR